MDEAQAHLTQQEVYGLINFILVAAEAQEEGMQCEATWPYEARDWCDLLVARLHGERS